MSENLKLWSILGRTDPAHTKGFTRGGGFKGTAIKPMWSYKRMTEEFGPCGVGWGIGEPQFQVLQGAEEEKLVFCTVTVWYLRDNDLTSERRHLVGVGGDKAVAKNKYGLTSDDEAFKKAFTDAITNALKLLGVGADVHMGLFDDNKYVASMRDEFSDADPAFGDRRTKHVKAYIAGEEKRAEDEGKKRQVGINQHTGAATAHSLKKDIDGPEGWNTFLRELEECQTTFQINKLKLAWSAISDTWPKETAAGMPGWKQIAIEEIRKRQEIILNGLPDDEDTLPDDNTPGDRGNVYMNNYSAG